MLGWVRPFGFLVKRNRCIGKTLADLSRRFSRLRGVRQQTMRKDLLSCCAAILLLTVLPCPAQQTETPTFRTGTTLIEFTIVALDNKGNPVTDLRKEEITILENAEPRDVAIFRFEGGGDDDAPSPAPLPSGLFSNRPEYTPGMPRNITAIVLDSLNTDWTHQMYVRDQLLRYLREIETGTHIAVYRFGERMAVIHDFTDDLESLRARVSKSSLQTTAIQDVDLNQVQAETDALIAGASSEGARESLQQMAEVQQRVEAEYKERVQDRLVELTLAALEDLGNHLAAIPGRKNLVWISSGIPTQMMVNGRPVNYEPLIRKTAQHLASQGVTLYPVEAGGLATESPQAAITSSAQMRGGRGSRQTPTTRAKQNNWAAADTFAKLTGGRASREGNDVLRGARQAAADLRGTYTVGFYAVGEPDGSWRRLEVKTARRGVRLTYRQGYQQGAPAEQPEEEWTQNEWRAAIFSPLGSGAVRLDARCEPVAAADPGTYELVLQIASGDLHFREVDGQMSATADIFIAEKTPSGEYELLAETAHLRRPPGEAAAVGEGLLRYTRRWQMKPETSTVRIIVRDRLTGLYGTLDMPVKEIPGAAAVMPAENPTQGDNAL
jgi:VWFA-related protein